MYKQLQPRMHRHKKLLVAALIFAVAFVAGLTAFWNPVSTSAQKKLPDGTILSVDKENSHCKCLNQIGRVSVKKAVKINNTVNDLYCTFDDPAQAMKNIKKALPGLLHDLSKGGLTELTKSNWKEYRQKMQEYKNVCPNNQTDDLMTLQCFFGIYGDDEKNQEILKEVQNYYNGNADSYEKLQMMLPYTTPLAQEANRKSLSRLQSSDVSSAIPAGKQ